MPAFLSPERPGKIGSMEPDDAESRAKHAGEARILYQALGCGRFLANRLTAWSDLQDLEEGRFVPNRASITSSVSED